MLRGLAALIGLSCMLGLPAQAMDHPPAPYGTAKVNNIYNMLFCDDPALFKDQNGQERFGAGAQVADVRKIAEDENEESRVRALAYNWLRARKESVPPGKLLGVIFEVPIDNGLDTLAVYADGRVRYINHTGVMSIFEGTPPEIAAGGKAIVASAATVVGSFKPSDKDRAPPPTVEVRVTLLTSDGLYVAPGILAGDRQRSQARARRTQGRTVAAARRQDGQRELVPQSRVAEHRFSPARSRAAPARTWRTQNRARPCSRPGSNRRAIAPPARREPERCLAAVRRRRDRCRA